MKNQKVPTRVGTVILIIIAITVGAIAWKIEKDKGLETVDEPRNIVEVEIPILLDSSNNQLDMLTKEKSNELMEDSRKHKDTKFGFEFNYPKDYNIESHYTPSTGEYFIKNTSGNITHIKITDWKNHIIKTGTSGTEYEKRAQYSWQYLIDNFKEINSGNCDDNIFRLPGVESLNKLENCIIDKQDNYIKIETDTFVKIYTKDYEIYFSSAPKFMNIMKSIAYTLKLN